MTTIRVPFFDIQIIIYDGEVGFASYYIDKDTETLEETTVFEDPSYPNLEVLIAEGKNPREACIDALGVAYPEGMPDLSFLPDSTEPGVKGTWLSEALLYGEYWDKFDSRSQAAIRQIGSGYYWPES